MRHVRVKLLKEDDGIEPSALVIDLVLGADRKPAHPIPFAGWWGKPCSGHWLRPLVFQPDGTVNWGGDAEDTDYHRFSRMPVHETAFTPGVKLNMWHLDEVSDTFVVVQITDLETLHSAVF